MKTSHVIYITLLLLMVALTATTKCVQRGDSKEYTQEEKIEYRWDRMSRKMMLSDAQSARAKTIYSSYINELSALRLTDNASEEEAVEEQLTEAQVKEKIAAERKKADIQEKYYDKFAEVLNEHQAEYVIKCTKVMLAEDAEDFANTLEGHSAKTENNHSACVHRYAPLQGSAQRLQMICKGSI